MNSDELNTIVETFNRTFSGQSTEEVREATETIQNWAKEDNFCGIILDLIAHPKSFFSAHTTLAFSAFLEDYVRRYWFGSNKHLISDFERNYFHDNLLLAIYNTSSIVADQLSEIFFHSSIEFPGMLWDDIVDEFSLFLQKAVEDGNALGFRNIVNANTALLKGIGQRSKNRRIQAQAKIIPQIEPFLREMFVNIVNSKEEQDGSEFAEEEFEIIFSILKWFEKANHGTINITIGSDINVLNEWFQILTLLICLPFRWDGMVVQEIGNHTLCKIQALSLKIFKFFAYRFIQGKRMEEEIIENRKDFLEHIIPEYILPSARHIIVTSKDNTKLPDSCIYPSLVLFTHMVTLGNVWSIHIVDTWTEFVADYIIPLVCFDEVMQEQWEENSILVFEKTIDPYSSVQESSTAALHLIIMSIQSRHNKSSWILTEFAMAAILAFQEESNEENVVACYGALSILAGVFKCDKNSFEEFFEEIISLPEFVVEYIIPLFESNIDFIMFRSLLLFESLLNNKLDYWINDESEIIAKEICTIVLDILFNHSEALKCAAIIVLFLICDLANFKELLDPYFNDIFENSFNLLNEYHIQEAGSLINKLIPMFPEKILPSALTLIAETYYAFEKAYEIYTSNDVDENDKNNAERALKSLYSTCIALLTQIPSDSSLWLDTIHSNDKESPNLFDYVLPMVKVTFIDEMSEFIEAGVDLLNVIGENTPLPFSNAIWELADDLFELIVKSPVYLEDLMDFYDSLFTRGCDEIEQNPSLIKLDEWIEFLVDLLQNNEEQGSYILNTVCTLIETIFVCYGKNLDDYVEELMVGLIMRLNGDIKCKYCQDENGLSPSMTLYYLHALMCLVFYNPEHFFTLATEKNCLEYFFKTFETVLQEPLMYKPAQFFTKMYLGVLHKLICGNIGDILHFNNRQLFALFLQALDMNRVTNEKRNDYLKQKTPSQFAQEKTDEWANNVKNASDTDDVVFNSVEIIHEFNDFYDPMYQEPDFQSSLASVSLSDWIEEISSILTSEEFESAFEEVDEKTMQYFNDILEGNEPNEIDDDDDDYSQ
eukprot:TRINITY_DN2482_c0_g1_i1.p1 TRINITY_DN2482_c0_g1~~TRINITY_DN2482_c0_g1_i1.p1  ORF type:complete len:1063 (+),score=321.94 TRINITY_DN2482_c0_g1_i1:33-3191(+)